MNKHLEHKGHFGSVEHGDVDDIQFGRIQLIRGLVTYVAADVQSLEAAFRDAVNYHVDLERNRS